MVLMEEIYKKLKTVFKMPGDGAPAAELKFRIPDPKLDEALEELVNKGTMSKYEFPPNSGMWHYKLKEKIDVGGATEQDAGSSNELDAGASSDQLKDLTLLVEEIAKELGDDYILNKVKEYKNKYNI